MPFCGLMKVGGLNTQQWGIYQQQAQSSWSQFDGKQEDEMDDEDNVPALSQGSTISNFSVQSFPDTPNGGKRRCEWDDSGEDEAILDQDVKQERGVALGDRVLAVPRRRRDQGSVSKVSSTGQENRVFGEDMDFGEAEFLDFSAIKGEVEMSDI